MDRGALSRTHTKPTIEKRPNAGRLDEARATVVRLRALTPEVMVNYPLPLRDPQPRELYFSGLRLALGATT
jgi:hypothetical protein